MQKKIFSIRDMHCSNCAMRIESLEDRLPGVVSASASYKKSRVVIEFDEAQVSEEAIILAIKKLGYSASLSNG